MAYIRRSISEWSMGSRIRETFNVPERNEERVSHGECRRPSCNRILYSPIGLISLSYYAAA